MSSSTTFQSESETASNLIGEGGAATRSQPSAFQAEIIATFVDVVHALGLPKSYGEIYGLLYATAQPLCFAEIHEQLDLSKGSVSGGVRALKEIGAIRSVSVSTDRREFFEPELELKKLLQALLAGRLEPQLKGSIERMARLETLLSQTEVDPASRRVLSGRVTKLGNWRRKASGLLPWIRKFLG